jgi:hypothetical protein
VDETDLDYDANLAAASAPLPGEEPPKPAPTVAEQRAALHHDDPEDD